MKLCSFLVAGEANVGVVKDDGKVYRIDEYPDMIALIRAFASYPQIAKSNIDNAHIGFYEDEITFLAPVLNPQKLIMIGTNYRDHVIETNSPMPNIPVVFSKYNSALCGNDAEVIIPSCAQKPDYEAEFAVVIGKRGKHISASNAMEYVFGYTIANDVSARDMQNATSQWLIGKSLDGFLPMGPYLVTKDEINNPHNLKIRGSLNGELRQNSSTKELIFNIHVLIAFLSRSMTLEPGDIISTGTPGGVIDGMKETHWLKDGDVYEIEIEKLGTLRNIFKTE